MKNRRIFEYFEFSLFTPLQKKVMATTVATIVSTVLVVKGCGGQTQQTAPVSAEGEPIPVPPGGVDGGASGGLSCQGIPAGTPRANVCPAGQVGSINEVCTNGVWQQVSNTCQQAGGNTGSNSCAGTVTFTQNLAPIIQKSCAGCHSGYAQADQTRRDFDKILTEIQTDEMPQGPNKLSVAEKKVFTDWKAGGFVVDPANCQGKSFTDLNDQAQAMLDFVNNVIRTEGAEEAKNIAFLSIANDTNRGFTGEDLVGVKAGAAKSLNSMCNDDEVVQCSWIGNSNVCAFNLEDCGLTNSDWNLIADADKFKFIDDTVLGRDLQQKTGKRQPWLFADNFAFTSEQAQVYYAVKKIPSNLFQYLANKGIDNINEEILKGEVTFAGGNGSPISLEKNRVVSWVESDDGFCSLTFDPVNNEQNRNFFDAPIFLFGNLDPYRQRGLENFAVWDASESICIQPNGMLEYALWNAAGVRQDFAPENIVHDTLSKFEPTIRNAYSCQGCHAKGHLPIEQQILKSVQAGGGNLNANEIAFVENVYGSQNKVNAIISSLNKKHRAVIASFGEGDGPGTYNLLVDNHRKAWGLSEFCAEIMIDEATCRSLIQRSPITRGKIGQLLDGGSITFDQRVNVFQDVKREFRLGLDPL